MKQKTWMTLVIIAAVIAGIYAPSSRSAKKESGEELTGAWRGSVQFTTGAFAATKDLEFMYVFNAGGTMTESSNYDAAPPVPPAYGVWRKRGQRQFEASYAFYITKAPESFADIAKGGGWSPTGRGVFAEKITLSDDGRSYKSTIVYTAFDQAGKPVEGGGEGTGAGARIGF